ncbi:MAG: sugar phosphate nucleotidyltransferase [Planctomycetota bacterium]
MNAIVLAAGFATRLYPLTKDRAKPLLDVAGRPVLSHIVDAMGRVPSLQRLILVSNARFYAQFTAWRDDYAQERRPSWPIDVIDDGATEAENRCGAVADLAAAWAQATDDAPALVAAGDNLIDEDLAGHAAAFAEDPVPTILYRHIDGVVPPRRYGEVSVDADGRLLRFREKPEAPETPLAATCLYLLPGSTRALLQRYLSGGGDVDAPGSFITWLSRTTPMRARPLQGRFFDIGNLESLARARAMF